MAKTTEIPQLNWDIPSDWKAVALGNVTADSRHMLDPQAFPDEEFDYYSIPAYQKSEAPAIEKGSAILSVKQLVEDGAVLFGKLNPRVHKVWRVNHPTHRRKIATTEFIALQPDGRLLDSVFLYFLCWTNHVLSAAKELVSGSTPSRQRVDVSAFRRLAIPLPPLPEQQAIAHVLRRVQQAKETTEKVIAASRQLKQSLMRHLFTYGPVPVEEAEQVALKESEIGPIPEHWQVVRLGDVARIGNGSTPKRTNERYWENGTIPWLTSGKVYERIIHQADEFVTGTAREECHLPLVKKGSVVVAITGQGKTLGHAALLDLATCVSQHLAYIQFNRSNVVPEFVLAFLQRQYAHFRQVSSAGGSTKGALTCAFLKGYPLPLPSVEEQREVANALRAMDRKIEVEVARGEALDALFKTLLHHLMTGKVRLNGIEGLAIPEGAPCR